jgi:hypothetical protein
MEELKKKKTVIKGFDNLTMAGLPILGVLHLSADPRARGKPFLALNWH